MVLVVLAVLGRPDKVDRWEQLQGELPPEPGPLCKLLHHYWDPRCKRRLERIAAEFFFERTYQCLPPPLASNATAPTPAITIHGERPLKSPVTPFEPREPPEACGPPAIRCTVKLSAGAP